MNLAQKFNGMLKPVLRKLKINPKDQKEAVEKFSMDWLDRCDFDKGTSAEELQYEFEQWWKNDEGEGDGDSET